MRFTADNIIYTLYDLLKTACMLNPEQERMFTRAIIKHPIQSKFDGYTSDDLDEILAQLDEETRSAVMLNLMFYMLYK